VEYRQILRLCRSGCIGWDNKRVSPLPPQPLSPLDGRYRSVVSPLGEYLSEAALNRARTEVELEWLIFLAERQLFGISPIEGGSVKKLREWVAGFGQAELDELARLEATTRHDVKAIEYLLRQKLEQSGLGKYAELVHFACTSEDINNLAHALSLREALTKVWLPRFDAVFAVLHRLAKEHRAVPMQWRL